MKVKSLIMIIASLALMMASGCKKEEKPGQLESIKFKQASYTIAENYLDFNLRKELETVPVGVIDTAKIKYVISDESVTAMNGNFLEPKRDGDITVTATIQGKSATCNVQITLVPLEDFSLEDFSVQVNGTAKAPLTTVPSGISYERFTWKVSNIAFATIDKSGVVTGLKEGTVTVTATAGDKSKTCTLTIEKVSVDNITLSKSNIEFTEIGSTEQLTATITPVEASYHKITWSSSNTSVATVLNGMVTCVGAGNAEITAAADGKEAKCSVTMPVIYVTSIKLTSDKDIVDVANMTKSTFTAELTPSNANEKIQWEVVTDFSSYSGDATITPSADGKSAVVIPTKVGPVHIKAYGEKTSTEYVLKLVSALGTVTDKCGNTYRTVKIGTQWWMAENLRCQRYGDNSGLAGVYILNALYFDTPPSNWYEYYCYYNTNSTVFQNWSDYNKDRVGYLYNWGAAVGLTSAAGAKGQTEDFSSIRQGICPDGWHLPTKAEWKTLTEYTGCGGIGGSTIKSDNGWYKMNGVDKYGFYALPVGFFDYETTHDYKLSGEYAEFWSATANTNTQATCTLIFTEPDGYPEYSYSWRNDKQRALSVRCVKN